MFESVVILAGGVGERLWPISTEERPKQFIRMKDGSSFFKSAVFRALALTSGNVIIVTRRAFAALTAKECASFSASERERIIIACEPKARHTCAAVLFAVHLSLSLGVKGEPMMVLTSDHVISPLSSFLEDTKIAAAEARRGELLTFGIKPTFPATSYGYIQTEGADNKVSKVSCFKEKPDEATARRYIEEGKSFWNSGMFAFTAEFFLSELKACSPDIYEAFSALKNNFSPTFSLLEGIKVLDETEAIRSAYSAVPSEAIDTALAEKTKNIFVVSSSFDWDDVGSFESLARYVEESDAVRVESERCSVYSDIPVSLCGVEDLTVVIKNGRALVMRRGRDDLLRIAAKKRREKKNG